MVRAMKAFTAVNKHVEAFGLEEVSKWEDCRQIRVSIKFMSHDLSQPIRSE